MSETRKYTAEQLVAVYRKMRAKLQEMEQAHKEQVAGLHEQLDAVSQELLAICNEEGADTIRTPEGTVSRVVSTRFWTSDWESMYEFIKEHDAYHLLEQRIHGSNMRQFLEEHEDLMPMGLQADRKYAIRVRKPYMK